MALSDEQALLDEVTPAIYALMREMRSVKPGVDYFFSVIHEAGESKVYTVPRGDVLVELRDSIPKKHPMRKALDRVIGSPSSPHARWVMLSRDGVFSVCSVMEVDLARPEGDA